MALFHTAFGVLVRDMTGAWIAATSETHRQQIHAARRANVNTIGNKERGRRVQEQIETIERGLSGDSALRTVTPLPPMRSAIAISPAEIVETSAGQGAH